MKIAKGHHVNAALTLPPKERIQLHTQIVKLSEFILFSSAQIKQLQQR
jgi:hypothetical protein